MRRLAILLLCACAHRERIITSDIEHVTEVKQATETKQEGAETITTTTEEYATSKEEAVQADGMPVLRSHTDAGQNSDGGQASAGGSDRHGEGLSDADPDRRHQVLIKRTVVVDQHSPVQTVTVTDDKKAEDTTVRTDTKTSTRFGPGWRFYLFALIALVVLAGIAYVAHRLKVIP